MVIFPLDKIDFKIKIATIYDLMMIEGSVREEDTTITNVYC